MTDENFKLLAFFIAAKACGMFGVLMMFAHLRTIAMVLFSVDAALLVFIIVSAHRLMTQTFSVPWVEKKE
jgi:hypothetical protein